MMVVVKAQEFPMANLVETITQAGSFSTLMKAVEAAGVRETLEAPGPFAILAPTDDAFAQLPPGELDALLKDTHKLKQVLMYHVLFGDVRSDDLAEIDEAPTVEGSVVIVNRENGKIQVNDANVLKTDMLADNGVVHTIDRVLIPTMIGENA
jgi:uncharacterized surface protein with fasciclin (FAS1) repeats